MQLFNSKNATSLAPGETRDIAVGGINGLPTYGVGAAVLTVIADNTTSASTTSAGRANRRNLTPVEPTRRVRSYRTCGICGRLDPGQMFRFRTLSGATRCRRIDPISYSDIASHCAKSGVKAPDVRFRNDGRIRGRDGR